MPQPLIWVLESLGPPLVRLGLKLLESKYPGISPLVDSMFAYFDGHPEPAVAIRNLQASYNAVAKIPPVTASAPDTVPP